MSASQIITSLFVAILVFWAVGAYNRLVGLRNVINRAFMQVDALIKRRHELISLLAEAARPHAADQSITLDAACAACNQARSALDLARARPCAYGAVTSLSMAEEVLDTVRARLLDSVQASADFDSDTALRDTTTELTATESKLAYARQTFNDAVTNYNDAVQQFPTRLLSKAYGFREAAALTPARNT